MCSATRQWHTFIISGYDVRRYRKNATNVSRSLAPWIILKHTLHCLLYYGDKLDYQACIVKWLIIQMRERERERERESESMYQTYHMYTHMPLFVQNTLELYLYNIITVLHWLAGHTRSFSTAQANRKHLWKQLLNFNVNGGAECPYTTALQCTRLRSCIHKNTW